MALWSYSTGPQPKISWYYFVIAWFPFAWFHAPLFLGPPGAGVGLSPSSSPPGQWESDVTTPIWRLE